jgi:hypothetical protein
MTDKNEKIITEHNPAPQSWVRARFKEAGMVTGAFHNADFKPGVWNGSVDGGWKPHPGPQEEFFNGPDVKYSSLAPSPNPSWKYCPGSLTKKGNPK